MKNMWLVVGGVVLLLVLIVGGTWISAHNREVSLRAAFEAQEKLNEASFDKMWKVIQQQAQLAETERESFRETYVAIMDATQGVAGEGALASFFTQAGVNVSSELFKQLMTSIEAQRESFFREQQKTLQIQAEHAQVRTRFPSSMFVGGREPLVARIITSSHTQEVFESGVEDDVNVFQN